MAGIVTGSLGIVVTVAMAPVGAIGTGFRLEGRFGCGHVTTQTAEHFRQHVVGLEKQTAAVCGGQDLHGDMSVAQVVGGPGEEERRIGCCLDQGLRSGDDLDHQRALLGGQTVTALEVVSTLQEYSRFPPGSERHLDSTAFALVVGEENGIGRRGVGPSIENQHAQKRK